MARISVICKNEKCGEEFVCETDGNEGEAFKSLGSRWRRSFMDEHSLRGEL